MLDKFYIFKVSLKFFLNFSLFFFFNLKPILRQEGDRLFHNAEMGPAEPGTNQSQLNIFTASPGEHIIHTNKYERLFSFHWF